MRRGATLTAERLRQEAVVKRLGDPDVVGLIHRWYPGEGGYDDILTEDEARQWDMHVLPMGWWIVRDGRHT